jgi:hypothetical protein
MDPADAADLGDTNASRVVGIVFATGISSVLIREGSVAASSRGESNDPSRAGHLSTEEVRVDCAPSQDTI